MYTWFGQQKLLILSIIASFIFLSIRCKQKEVVRELFISKKEGAKIYSEPSEKSKLLKVLPANDKLFVIENTNTKIIVNSEVGNWLKLKLADGFIFSSDLSNTPVEFDYTRESQKTLEKGYWYARKFNVYSQRLLFKGNKVKLLEGLIENRFDIIGSFTLENRDVKVTWQADGDSSNCILRNTNESVFYQRYLQCEHNITTENSIATNFFDKRSKIKNNSSRTIGGFPVVTLGYRIGKLKEDTVLYINPDVNSTKNICTVVELDSSKDTLPQFTELTFWARSKLQSEINGVTSFWYYVQINSIPGDHSSHCLPSDSGWVFGTNFRYTKMF